MIPSDKLADGERRKSDVLDSLAERRDVCVNQGRRALLLAMLSGDDRATADDVYPAVELPPGLDPRCLGAVPKALARHGIIRSVGFVRSARPQRHASPIQQWELADPTAAERWLRENPELPDPVGNGEGVGPSQGLLFSLDPESTPTPPDAASGVDGW